jgi:acyl carrier protein
MEEPMTREELKQQLVTLMEDTKGEKIEGLSDDTDLRTGLGLDSVDMVGLVLEVQDKLNLQLSITDFEQVQTFGQLLDVLLARLAASTTTTPKRAAA